MLLSPSHDVNAIAQYLIGLVGRGTFPMSQIADGHESCAFLFNDLLASDDDSETVATWILTADAMTYVGAGVFAIRPEMTEGGAPSADIVIITEYEQSWYHFPDIGVAAMPMAVLRGYAARKEWGWSTQEITDGLAANAHDIAALGEVPHTLLAMGHPTDQRGRPPGVAVARIDMRGGVPALLGSAERGFIGGPAFVAFPNPGSADSNELMLKCIGVVCQATPHTPSPPLTRSDHGYAGSSPTTLRRASTHTDHRLACTDGRPGSRRLAACSAQDRAARAA